MKRFLTGEDIREAQRLGKREISVSAGTVVTDLAIEMARSASITIREIREIRETRKIEEIAEPALFSNLVSKKDEPGGDLADLLLTGAQVIIPEIGTQRVNVAIHDGKIAALTTGTPRARRVIDLSGKHLLPGIIDPHIHLGLFASLDEELRTESRAALIGGVTGAGCFFNQAAGYLPLLEELSRKVPALSHIDLLPHLTLRERLHLQELPEYRRAGVRSFKMYMCGIPGILPHQDDGFILKGMERLAATAPDALLCVHAENSSIVADRTDELTTQGAQMTLQLWGATHPEISEEEAVTRAVLFATRLGVRLYLVHIGTKTAIETLSRIKGENIFVETTSPYLSLNDERNDDRNDVNLKMVPPIRDRETGDILWNALEKGVIDTIGTDNTTLTSREKGRDMRDAMPGYPALGTHLPSVLSEGTKRGVPLEKIVPAMTLAPARILGLYPRKGTILPGGDADLVAVDMNKEKRVSAAELGGRSDFVPHEGEVLRGWPVMTIKDGRVAAEDGHLTGAGAAAVRGKLLRA
ncbi:MAG: amidohydrolase family protein [Synergistaceae bacterium]|jgi:dihydropyrimidinase|nr:amidohydrolase family protein [Synergistaceae bacterium]